MLSLMMKNDGFFRMYWLLPVSLALNLAFLGATGAMAFRYSNTVPLAAVARIDHSATDRLDRLAAILPSNDAAVMRTELRADALQVAAAQADFRLSQEQVRNLLRAEPFDLNAMHTAMAQVQLARDHYHLVLHDVIEAAAFKMSGAGRNKLADWSSTHDGTTTAE